MMSWGLSYLGANFSLVVVVMLLVAGLGAIAFFAKNWKAAVAAGAVLAAGFAYQHVDKIGYQRRIAEEAQQQVEALERRLDVLNAANEADALRARADADRISELEGKVHETPANDRVALDRAAVGRVSAIRWDAGDGGAAAGTGGSAKLLPRRGAAARP